MRSGRLTAWQRMITSTAADFAARCRRRGKLAGLDVGTKTIGLAICDAGWQFRRPVRDDPPHQVHRRPGGSCAAFIAASMSSGWSSACRSTWTAATVPRTQSVRAFARNLAPLDLPILLWDERWSTQAVERAMIDADISRAKRAEKIDAHAAAHILQGAIDALANLAGAAVRPRARGPALHRFAERRPDRDHPRRGRALVRRQPRPRRNDRSARRPDHLQPLLRKFDAHR